MIHEICFLSCFFFFFAEAGDRNRLPKSPSPRKLVGRLQEVSSWQPEESARRETPSRADLEITKSFLEPQRGVELLIRRELRSSRRANSSGFGRKLERQRGVTGGPATHACVFPTVMLAYAAPRLPICLLIPLHR